MSIRPLPDDVVAQIKSSTAIVSLTGVVLELLKNALDARATRIHVTVDFARGGCTVEDDGLGISPAELSERGGLGKPYWTSKYQTDESHLGQHGSFLASLSAMSLLTITSHHHAHRSHNSITFHHSHAIERQTPTPAQNNIHGKHGTRVTVRNLFGNMPVRVKQRAIITDHKAEQGRLRDALRRNVAGLLLSWQGPVSLKIRDGDNKTTVNFNTSNAAGDNLHSAQLSSLLHIMTQANYIAIDEWSSWVPASASTAALSVKGAISLKPSPTKQVQFISFGIRPLSSENSCNELYDEVNRLFALSSFGTIEDDADVDEKEQLRRQSDKRFKNDGYTNRQLKSRKGVDRYPMYHLRISLKDRCPSDMAEERFIENESNLQAVVGIFSAMITQWLSVHHFCPRKPNAFTGPPKSALVHPRASEQTRTSSRKRQASSSTPAISATYTPKSKATATDTAKRVRMDVAPLPRAQAFAEWSRIKSGKSSFFETPLPNRKFAAVVPVDPQSIPVQDTDRPPRTTGIRQEYTAFDVPSVGKGALNQAATSTSFDRVDCQTSKSEGRDDTVSWTDPITKKIHLINARTGSVVPPRRPQTDTSASSSVNPCSSSKTILRMGSKSATDLAKRPWLEGLLQDWDNPVFKPSAQGIQQMSLQNDLEDGQGTRWHHNHTHCSPFNVHKAFRDVGLSSARLSKDALHSAEVISQVDKKFILVRMTGLSVDSTTQSTSEIMVLIDQHAADERIQVEALLSNLCRPSQSSVQTSFTSNLGCSSPVEIAILDEPLHFTVSSNEYTHFEAFAANFAAWGVLYDISTTPALNPRLGTSDRTACKIAVTALPPAVSQRCTADPRVLIAFLRSAVWRYVDSPPPQSSQASDEAIAWVRRIATCPPGLIDMINSRACRSAIMFNDELSLGECTALVEKLAQCVFPFMCAHARPSMVPIVDLGRVWGCEQDQGYGEAFVGKWKAWRNRLAEKG